MGKSSKLFEKRLPYEDLKRVLMEYGFHDAMMPEFQFQKDNQSGAEYIFYTPIGSLLLMYVNTWNDYVWMYSIYKESIKPLVGHERPYAMGDTNPKLTSLKETLQYLKSLDLKDHFTVIPDDLILANPNSGTWIDQMDETTRKLNYLKPEVKEKLGIEYGIFVDQIGDDASYTKCLKNEKVR